jgi:hypothetical protein
VRTAKALVLICTTCFNNTELCWTCSTNGRNAYRILVGKCKERRTARRHRRKWKDNIKINLKGIECKDVEWIHLAQDGVQCRAVVNTVVNLRIL